MTQILYDGLSHHFSLAIRTVGFEFGRFGDRDDRWGAVHSGRGGIYNPSAIEFVHNLE